MFYLGLAFHLIFLFWLPWWFIILFGFVGGWISSTQKVLVQLSLSVFFASLAITYYFDLQSQMAYSQKMSQLFPLPHPLLFCVFTSALFDLLFYFSGLLTFSIKKSIGNKTYPANS